MANAVPKGRVMKKRVFLAAIICSNNNNNTLHIDIHEILTSETVVERIARTVDNPRICETLFSDSSQQWLISINFESFIRGTHDIR